MWVVLTQWKSEHIHLRASMGKTLAKGTDFERQKIQVSDANHLAI